MTQPSAYSRSKDFSENNGSATDHNSLNSELDQIANTLNQLIQNMGILQRDDTALANGAVHQDAFSTGALLLMSGKFNPRGAWATAQTYEVSDLVNEASETYVCMEAHTSGTFSTDHAAEKWMTLSVDSSISAANATAAANSATQAETALDEFTDLYLGRKATLPTLDNDGNALQAGAICQLTTDNALYIYSGASWIVATASSQINEFEFTASGGQVDFSGPDDNTNTLAYTPGKQIVFINGVMQPRDAYTATNGTNIVLNTGASAGELVSVLAYVSIATTDFDSKADKIVPAADVRIAVLDGTTGNLEDGGYTVAELIALIAAKSAIGHLHTGVYEPADANIVKAPSGVLPALNGAALTNLPAPSADSVGNAEINWSGASGSWAIGSNATYYPPAGIYIFKWDMTNGSKYLDVYVNGGWVSYRVFSTTGVDYIGVPDGNLVRFRDTYGASSTVYYQRVL